MKLEVEVVSREMVRPSSPTPDRLCNYQLSFLDQLTPRIYNPFVYFYPDICDTEANKIKTSDHLKQSIAKALTYFYPLAGLCMENQHLVDCNDAGITFVEARVNCQLSEFVDNPDLCEMNKFLPFKMDDYATEFLLGIQINIFECGGIGIGVCISHIIGDALSFFMFVNMWAAISRGVVNNLNAPEYVSASLFPPRELSGFPSIRQTKEGIVTKRFVFTASKTEEIRTKYSDLEYQIRPTRVEALSAFIFTRFVTSTGAISKSDTLFSIALMINLRTRMDPPQSECSFGNLSSFIMTYPSIESIGSESCHKLVTQMKDSIKAMDSEYVKKIQDGHNHRDFTRERTASYAKGEMISLSFASLCRFPIYDADFGWGKPIWAATADRYMPNSVVFVDTVVSNGIEAWVSLKEDDMAKFDSDKELLYFVN